MKKSIYCEKPDLKLKGSPGQRPQFGLAQAVSRAETLEKMMRASVCSSVCSWTSNGDGQVRATRQLKVNQSAADCCKASPRMIENSDSERRALNAIPSWIEFFCGQKSYHRTGRFTKRCTNRESEASRKGERENKRGKCVLIHQRLSAAIYQLARSEINCLCKSLAADLNSPFN